MSIGNSLLIVISSCFWKTTQIQVKNIHLGEIATLTSIEGVCAETHSCVDSIWFFKIAFERFYVESWFSDFWRFFSLYRWEVVLYKYLSVTRCIYITCICYSKSDILFQWVQVALFNHLSWHSGQGKSRHRMKKNEG